MTFLKFDVARLQWIFITNGFPKSSYRLFMASYIFLKLSHFIFEICFCYALSFLLIVSIIVFVKNLNFIYFRKEFYLIAPFFNL